MSRAGFMHAQLDMLRAIGRKPPLWRPLARLRWKRKHDAVVSLSYEEYERHYREAVRIVASGEYKPDEQTLHVLRGGKS